MKENDWIVATLNNPTFDVGDFQHISGITLDNTLLLSKDQYLKSNFIRENPNFLTNDQFDADKFNSFYEEQVKKFGEFSTESVVDNYEYSMWDTARPAKGKIKEESIKFSKVPNPDHIKIGIEGFNTVTLSDLSRREWAQKSKIKDTETGLYLDKSVDDISLFESPLEYFKSIISDPLVYAAYDEDGTHIDPFTKLEVEHKKGEWKLNDLGEYYTETLNGRSLIGKEAVSVGDYVTSENSKLNDYDFFDSDGLDKSVTGTIAKNLAVIAPLVFLGPTGASIYGGLFVARELSKTLPMLYGMYLSFTLLDSQDSKLLNTIAAYGNRLTSGTSEYAQQNTFSAENFLNLAGDVVLQWGQLKAIANAYTKLTTGAERSLNAAYNKAAQEYLKNSVYASMAGDMSKARLIELTGASSTEEIFNLVQNGKWVDTIYGKAAKDAYTKAAKAAMESRIKTGQDLSLVYMSLISNTDVYQSVLEKGGTPFEAAAIALGSTIGMFSVDKYAGLGEMFFDSQPIRNSFRQAWKKEGSDIIDVIKKEKGMSTAAPTKKDLTNIIDKSIDKARNFVTNYHSKIKDNTLGFIGKSIGEGLEELSEELVTDVSKSLGELLGKLGYASQTDYGAWDNAFERYTMSLLGGAIGGGLFYGVNAYQTRNDPKTEEGENELIYLIRNHKKEDLMRELDRLHDKGKLGSTSLSYETTKGNDNKEYFITADENHISQNDYIYQRLKEVYNHLDIIINNNRVGLSEEELFLNLVMSDLRLNAMKDYLQKKSYSTGYLQEFHKLVKQIVETDLAIEELNRTTPDPNKRNEDATYQEKLASLMSKKQELENKRDLFLNGELSLEYIEKMQFAIDPRLCGLFMSVNIDLFTREKLGHSYDEISIAEREDINKKYAEYQRSERYNLDKAFKIYKDLENELAPEVERMSLYDAKAELERFQGMLEKDVVNQFLKWDSKLPNETEEEFQSRNNQPEDVKEKRKEAIKLYNNEHIAEFVKNFSDVGLDNSNYRLMHLLLLKRRKDITEDLINGFKFGDKFEDSIEVDAETTDYIKSLLYSGKSAEDIVKDLRTYLLEKQKNSLKVIYSDEMFQDDAWSMFKEFYADGNYLDERLTASLAIEILRNIELFIKSKTEFQEDEPTNVHDTLVNIFNEYLVRKLENLLALDDEITKAREIYNTIKDDVLTEFLNTGRIDPSNLSQEDLQLVDEEINSRMGDINKDLTTLLSEIFPNEGLSKITLTFDLINSYLDLYVEVNTLFINNSVSEYVENTIAAVTPGIDNAVEKLQNNPYLKAFDSLELNLYKNNPALKFLNGITAKIGNVKVNVEDFLQSLHLQYLEIEDYRDFKLNEEQKKTLQTLLENLRTAAAFIYAASKNTTFNSPIGQNKAINEFIKNHSDVFKSDLMLPEMTPELGLFLLLELSSYEREINTWLDLSDPNRIDKKSMFLEAEAALDKSLKGFYDTNKSRLVVNGINLLEGYTNETTVLEAERMLYNNVLKGINDGKFTLEDVFDIIKYIVTDPKNIENLVPSKLDNKLQYLNDYDKFTYFITTISLSPDQYRRTLKNFIENNKNIVPISLLMYAGRILQAMQVNPLYVNAALRYIKDKYDIKAPFLPNTTVCTGVGGAGKSEILGRIAIIDQGSNAWVSGPTSDLIDGLLKKLPKAKSVNILELVKKIIGKKLTADLLTDIETNANTSNFYSVIDTFDNNTTTILKDSVVILEVLNPPEVIIIDEATHVPNILLQIISKFAEQNNIQLLLLGDNALSGVNHGAIKNISKEHVFAWRTPKLFISLRDTNVLKYYNQQRILLMFEPLLDSVGESELNIAINLMHKLLPKFLLRYHIGTELAGDMITTLISPEIIRILKNNKDSQGNQIKVAFIGKPDSPYYKLLENAGVALTDALSLENIQGREFDYVVADLDWNIDINDSQYNTGKFFRNLYTTITRSKKGTIIIDNGLSDKVGTKLELLTGVSTDIRNDIEVFRKNALEDLKDVPSTQQTTPLNQATPKSTLQGQPATQLTPQSLPTSQTPNLLITPQGQSTPQQNQPTPQSTPQSTSMKDISLDEETSLTSTTEETEKAEEESKKEVQKFELNEEFPVRLYMNVHTRNATERKEGEKTIWIGNGSNKDISIFLKNGEEVETQKDRDDLIKLLLQIKCLIAYGTPETIDEYYALCDERIVSRFDKSAFVNVETFIVAEKAGEDNLLIGLTNLKLEKRAIKDGYMISVVARLKDKYGDNYTVTLGGVADPKKWDEYADILLSSSRATDEEKEYARKLKNGIINSYSTLLEKLIKEGEIPVNVNFSLLTELISKDGDGNPNPEIRLRDIDSNRTPYDNKTKYAVRSKVYIPKNKDLTWISEKLIGRPVMFVSSNIFLNPDDLMTFYINLKEGGIDRGVRLVPLSNKGVSFKSLYRELWRNIYTIKGNINTMPFELFPEAIRMYIAMWNFRANLNKFVTVFKEWRDGANIENRKLSDDEINEILKLDQEEYNKAKGEESYIDEATYRSRVSDEVKAKLQILWSFNDRLAESVREFRLGYDTNNGVRIKTLTNLTQNNAFYGDRISNGESIKGIYIMPKLAETYLETLNALFENVINKIVPTDRDISTWIDKEETLTDDWFNLKLRDTKSIEVSGFDKNGNPVKSNIVFNNESSLKMIPLAMVLMSKYLEIRLYDTERFNNNYYNPRDPEKPPYHITITNENNEKESLDYISVATTLGLLDIDKEGVYQEGLGLKPYAIDKETGNIGTIDRRLDNLMSLMFHGLVETKRDNYFDDPSDLRATDADFKYGFFSDPVAIRNGEENFYLVATNEALFSTNLLPGFPIATFNFGKPKPKQLTLPLTTPKPVIDTLTPLKLDVANLADQLDINISKKVMNKINSEQELIDFVNLLLNPKFAKGENQNQIDDNKSRSYIYQYFTQKGTRRITLLFDHVELVNGNLIFKLLDLGLDINDSWTEEWDKVEDCCKILTSPDNKKYKIRFDKQTGEISKELLNQIDFKGEPDPESNKILPTPSNIQFTLHYYVDEYMNSVTDDFKDDLYEAIDSEFEGLSNEDMNDPNVNQDTINRILNNIVTRFKNDFDYEDIENYESWTEGRRKFIDIIPNIIIENRLLEGCIN